MNKRPNEFNKILEFKLDEKREFFNNNENDVGEEIKSLVVSEWSDLDAKLRVTFDGGDTFILYPGRAISLDQPRKGARFTWDAQPAKWVKIESSKMLLLQPIFIPPQKNPISVSTGFNQYNATINTTVILSLATNTDRCSARIYNAHSSRVYFGSETNLNDASFPANMGDSFLDSGESMLWENTSGLYFKTISGIGTIHIFETLQDV